MTGIHMYQRQSNMTPTLQVLAIIQTMPFLIMWPRFVLSVRHSCALSHLPEVAVPRMSLA